MAIVAVLVGLVLLAQSLTLVEARAETGQIRDFRGVQPKADSYLREIHEARMLLKHGKLDEAIEILERLYAAHPRSERVILDLGAALVAAGALERAETLYRAAIDAGGDAPSYLNALWDAYRRSGVYDEALAVCIELVERFPSRYSLARDMLRILLDREEFSAKALERLRDRVAQQRSGRMPMEVGLLLAEAYLQTGDADAVLDLMRDLDDSWGEEGRMLFAFGAHMEEKEQVAAAERAYRAALRRDPPAELAEECSFKLGRLLARQKRLAPAESVFAEQVGRFPTGPFAVQADLERGRLLLALGRPEEVQQIGEKLLHEIKARKKGKSLRTLSEETRFLLGEALIHQGKFEEASEQFDHLAASAVRQEMREKAAYEKAEMLFFQGSFVDAEEAYFHVVDAFPDGSLVNDALERILVLGEKMDNKGIPLTALAQILYQGRLGNNLKALELCDESLDAYPAAAAADAILFEKLKLLSALERWEEAEATTALFVSQWPESRMAPRTLKWMGDALRGRGEKERAQSYYEDLIMRYPDALQSRQIRSLLNQEKREQS